MNALFGIMQNLDLNKVEVQEQCQSPLKAKMKSKNQDQKIEALMIKQKQEKLRNAITEKTLTKNTGTQVKDFMQKSDLLINKYSNQVED